ncbi:SIMPL domain-containing protein [Sulfurospirillum sp. 1612]|uniref:SIMPL domain-containing protein n=1 Tax=Sulfurospirillum sp. 1612 TaxID=3094835 RepID=UPI002F92D0DF
MSQNQRISFFILGIFIFLGLSSLGYLLSNALIQYKQFDRSVTVKGLSEREYPADIVIWPIQFTSASNNLSQLYESVEKDTQKIKSFLLTHGIKSDEITLSTPSITDKSAQEYGNNTKPNFRYIASQTVTVYSKHVEKVRAIMSALSSLGKEGIVFTNHDYQSRTEYLFSRLNEVKPGMIEEATKKAREVAEKFALDSHSKLGKIKRASQGSFSITQRDKNNPQIKKVRVVSTVEYYLSD